MPAQNRLAGSDFCATTNRPGRQAGLDWDCGWQGLGGAKRHEQWLRGFAPRQWPEEEIRGNTFPPSTFFSTACRPFSGIRYQEQIMSMNKDQVAGRVKEVKGKIKEVAGNLVGNETMEAKGKIQKTLGEAQAKFGDIKKDLQDAKKSS
jgi:uncharacterized protein YjbJ (UPF0337 family)